MSSIRVDKGKGKPRGKRATSTEILDRQPPHNPQAEMAVLGSVLIKPETCDEVALILRPEDFYDQASAKLFERMLGMHDTGRKIDITLLVDELRRHGEYDVIGGAPFLARVGNSVPTAAHAVYYAQIVRNDATCRSLIDASTEILRESYEENIPPKELVNRAEQKIFSILDRRGSAHVAAISDILHDAMDRIDARMRGEHLVGGVESGFRDLDALTGGLHDAELVVLAARPSMGKTAFAMNIAENVSLLQKAPVLFVSLEMSAIELADRMLCSLAQVDSRRLRNGTISKEDRKRLVDKAAGISESPLYVDDSPNRTVTEISAAARRIARRHDNHLGLIVIDYLQLIEPDDPRDPRQEQVAKMTRRLKGLAREMNVPILCLAQLNRQAEVAKENRPRLSHLRESGAIEQDADVVMFVHREEYYRTGEDRDQVAGLAEIIVAKQRNGPIGDVELVWRKEFTRFADRAPDHYDDLDQFSGTEFR